MSLPPFLSLSTVPMPGVRSTAGAQGPAPTSEGQPFDSLVALAGDSPVSPRMERGYRDLPGYGRIATVKVTHTQKGPDGKEVHKVEELAVCPECGTVNCACLARVTLQSRLDEENASGVRHAEKPQPFAVMPQSFHQMSLGLASAQGGSASRMFG